MEAGPVGNGIPDQRVCASFVFWACVKEVGNLTSTLTIKSPRRVGCFGFGMPCAGNFSSNPGGVGPAPLTRSCLPSIVLTVRDQPVSASLRLISMVVIRSSPTRFKCGCSFCRIIVSKGALHTILVFVRVKNGLPRRR